MVRAATIAVGDVPQLLPASPVQGCGAGASVVDEVVEHMKVNDTERYEGDQLY